MPGFSITLLLLSSPTASASGPSTDQILSLLDESTSTPGWKWSSPTTPSSDLHLKKILPLTPGDTTGSETTTKETLLQAKDPKAFNESVQRACEALIQAEGEITRMDSIAGDGDCGTTLKVGTNVPPIGIVDFA